MSVDASAPVADFLRFGFLAVRTSYEDSLDRRTAAFEDRAGIFPPSFVLGNDFASQSLALS
jgi:hypothetical protein